MIDILRIALVPVIGVGAAIMYRRFPNRAMFVLRAAMFSILVMVIALVITGRLVLASSSTHRVLGHVFVIVLWLLTPAGVGGTAAEAMRSRRWLRLSHTIVIVLLLGTGFLAAMSGYLPKGQEASAPEQLRFAVLHEVASPVLTVVLVLAWMLVSRGYARKGKPLAGEGG